MGYNNMLYPLTAEYTALMDDSEDFDEESLNGMADMIRADIKKEAENATKVVKNWEAEYAKFKAESDRLAGIAEMYKNRVVKMKELIFACMNKASITEVPSDLFTIKVQKNGGLAPLIIDESATIPDEYKVIKTDIDNTKIREALKTKKLDFAHLGERGTHLVIK